MSTYDAIEKRLIEVLSDSENKTPTIKEIANELGCTSKLINTRFVKLASGITQKRKSEIARMNDISSRDETYHSETWIKRVCLGCDKQFNAKNKFIRLCETCKSVRNYE